MIAFIASAAFALAGINMRFKQGQANPQAHNFFKSAARLAK